LSKYGALKAASSTSVSKITNGNGLAVAGSGRDLDAVTATVEIIERSLHATVVCTEN
jgi:hypothetical protein